MEQIEWIETSAALEGFCAHARSQTWVTFDTEFMRDNTYYAQLALVQIATKERVVCIDPIALADLGPLEDLLFDPNVLKVVHAGTQDLEIFYFRCDRLVQPLFDTQIAASLLGYGEQVGYAPLVEAVCKKILGKGHQRADWMRRPLSKATLEYAANDVTFLRDVYQKLEQDLVQLGRREWLDEEQRSLLDPGTFVPDENKLWLKLKGKQKLRGVACEIAKQLAIWRETEAQRLNKPRRRILADETIVDIAMRAPVSVDELLTLRSAERIPNKVRHPLVQIVHDAQNAPKSSWPMPYKRNRQQVHSEATLLGLQTVLQIQAERHKISPSQLASQSELAQLSASNHELSVLRGWRRKLAGEVLLQFLEGTVSIAHTEQGVELIEVSSES